jgi:Hermansky-Pudlak syndrome 1 protein
MCESEKKPTADQDKILRNIAALVTDKLSKHIDLLESKSKNNFTMCSYLDEFAGLVHFIFIDRQRGTYFSPNIEMTAKETSSLIKKKVWEMIETSRMYLQNGQTTVIWKDFGFSYSYALWFEDSNGQALKPNDQVSALTAKSSSIPGMLAYDFYQ